MPKKSLLVNILLLLFIFILTGCIISPFSSPKEVQAPTIGQNNSPQTAENSSCNNISQYKLCVSFAFTDARGTFVGLKVVPVSNKVDILTEEFVPDGFSIKKQSSLVDARGKVYDSLDQSILFPTGSLKDLDGTKVLSFSPVEADKKNVTLKVPFIVYTQKVNTKFKMEVDPDLKPGESVNIDVPIDIDQQTLHFQTMELQKREPGANPIYVEGEIRKELEDPSPGKHRLDLIVKSSSISFVDDKKIIGLQTKTPNASIGFRSETQQHYLLVQFQGDNISTGDRKIEIHIQSVWIVERGPFEVTFQVPTGEQSLVEQLSSSRVIHSDNETDRTNTSNLLGQIYIAQYGLDSGQPPRLLRQKAKCLNPNTDCPGAGIVHDSFPLTYSFSWAPDGKKAALLDNDKQVLQIYFPGQGGWKTVIEGVKNFNKTGDWSPDSDQFAFAAQSKKGPRANQVMILDPETGELQVVAEDISDDKEVVGWLDENTLVFVSHLDVQGGALTQKLYRYDSSTKQRESMLDWPDGLQISLSPMGKHLAFYDPEKGLMVMDVHGANKNLLPVPGSNFIQWSPDGQWISTYHHTESAWETYIVRPDGSDSQLVFQGRVHDLAWGPESKHILILSDNDTRNQDLNPKVLFLITIQDKIVQKLQIPMKNEVQGRIEIFWSKSP